MKSERNQNKIPFLGISDCQDSDETSTNRHISHQEVPQNQKFFAQEKNLLLWGILSLNFEKIKVNGFFSELSDHQGPDAEEKIKCFSVEYWATTA